MYRFSKRSLSNLEGVHPKGVSVVKGVMALQVMDFGVYEGVRTLETQRTYFNTGRSKTMNSKHLIQKDGYGHAVDLYPYPIDMNRVNKGDAREIVRFGVLNGLMQAVGRSLGVKVISGIDWDGDGQTLDHTFFDAMHWQFEI